MLIKNVFRLTRYRFLIIAMISFFLSACNESPLEPLNVASSPWPGYEPLYLARELNYLSEDKFKLLDLPSSDITYESFRNGSSEIATVTLDEALELIHEGTRLKIIAVMDVSNGADAAVASSEVKTIADLKGKRIAIINITLGYYMLNRLLEKAGLTTHDVDVYPMAEIKQEEFYQKGKADVVITFDPMKSRILKKGAHVIFDSSDIPNEILDVLVVNQDTHENRKNDICQLVAQWNKSLDFMKSKPKTAAIKISKRNKISLQDYKKMMSGVHIITHNENMTLMSGESPGIEPIAKRLIGVMKNIKIIDNDIDISQYISNEYVGCK